LPKLYRLAAFPRGDEGGNEAAMIFNGDLDEGTMQRIAHYAGYSETAFVRVLAKDAFSARFFTPTAEVDMCGHATVAAFNALRDEGRIPPGVYALSTKAGPIRVLVGEKDVQLGFAQPVIETLEDPSPFARLLNVDGVPPVQRIDSGVCELYVKVERNEDLKRLHVDSRRIAELLESYDASGLCVYTEDALTGGDIFLRNFLPPIGIPEESATGTACVSLAASLHEKNGGRIFMFEQGDLMGKPSRITARVENSAEGMRIYVGGTARLIEKEDISVQDG